MQPEILLHKPHIHPAQHYHRTRQVHIPVLTRTSQVAHVHQALHRHIHQRNRYMRNPQLVRHQLVQVFPVGQSDILVQK